MSNSGPKEPRYRIVPESLTTETLLVIDTQGEGEQTPQELRALVSSKAITQVELAEIQAWLERALGIATMRDNLRLLALLPTQGVDTSEKCEWQNVPNKGQFMFCDSKWATITKVMVGKGVPPSMDEWSTGNSVILTVVQQGQEDQTQIIVNTYHRFREGPEYRSVLAENPKSVCKFVEPSRLQSVGITVSEE